MTDNPPLKVVDFTPDVSIVVHELEELLAQAREGKITAFVGAVICSDGSVQSIAAVAGVDDCTLIGALEITKAWLINADDE